MGKTHVADIASNKICSQNNSHGEMTALTTTVATQNDNGMTKHILTVRINVKNSKEIIMALPEYMGSFLDTI